MSQFEFLSVALSFVLGLAVTLLLTSFLIAFRARHRTRMGWVPLTWAVYVLVMQFDLWWQVYGLSSIEAWSVSRFVLLLVVALSLFAAGGLVLPYGRSDYPRDGDDPVRHLPRGVSVDVRSQQLLKRQRTFSVAR